MREVSVGESLDQFQLTEVIARSGMASIFKAIDLDSGQIVAIKVPYIQFETDVIFFNRFQREEELLRRLNHRNIIRLVTPEKKSRMYIAMEFIDGGSLRDLMQREQPIAPDRALHLAAQICEAIAYMHQQGVVHRDIKPENILVTRDGIVKVMDFGIALDEQGRHLTWSGTTSTIGTPDYMAPEQVDGRHGDARTDVYSLGVILYEMLTAKLPYGEGNIYNVMRAKTHEDPLPPSRYRPSLDPALEEIVLHALERIPKNRYQSAAEMLNDLRDPSRVQITGRAQRLRPRSARARKFLQSLLIGAFFAAVIGVFAFLIWLADHSPARHSQPPGLIERK